MHRELPCWKGISIEKRESWIKSHQINNMSPCQWHLIGDPLSLLLQGSLFWSYLMEPEMCVYEDLCSKWQGYCKPWWQNFMTKGWNKALKYWSQRHLGKGLTLPMADLQRMVFVRYRAFIPAVHKKKHLTQPDHRLIIGLWYLHQWISHKIQRQWTMPRNFQPCQKLVHGFGV